MRFQYTLKKGYYCFSLFMKKSLFVIILPISTIEGIASIWRTIFEALPIANKYKSGYKSLERI
jgi:hypothetical protein